MRCPQKNNDPPNEAGESSFCLLSSVLIYLLSLVESYGKLISATAGSLSTGTASAFSGQHDVGHKGVATGSGVLSLYSFVAQSGCGLPGAPAASLSSQINLLFPLEALLCSERRSRQLHSRRFRYNQLACHFFELYLKNMLSIN